MWKSLKQTLTSGLAVIALLFSGAVAAQDNHPAQALVESAIMDMLSFLEENLEEAKANPKVLQAKVDEVVVPHIDFKTMTRLSVGKKWKLADQDQQLELVNEFQALLLNTYTTAMTEYGGEKIDFERFRPEKRDDRAVVRSSFNQAGSSPVPVNYKMRDKSGWKIYDIEVAGLSLVNNFRQKFTDEINRNGIDGLLTFLRERNSRS